MDEVNLPVHKPGLARHAAGQILIDLPTLNFVNFCWTSGSLLSIS